MNKILIVSTVSKQFYLFEQGNIEVLKSLGYEVHTAANYSDANERLDSLDIIRHHFDIERSPMSLKNIFAYKQLKEIMRSENFDVVHCHSPMGGVLARLAAKSVGISSVIYTAHGFHFFKGAPIINWLVYYPVEKFLSRLTDILITINKEDYARAQKFQAKRVEYVPGIGIDLQIFDKDHSLHRTDKRKELGLPVGSKIILSVGELNKNKNQRVIIEALAKINDPNLYYLICGQGDNLVNLKKLALSLGVYDKVKFLGYRNDVTEIYNISDIFAFPSFREGLSVSLMEAMASRLPIVCSDIRGNRDLIDQGKGGYLINTKDADGFFEAIKDLLTNQTKSKDFGLYNSKKVLGFAKEDISKIMTIIYRGVL